MKADSSRADRLSGFALGGVLAAVLWSTAAVIRSLWGDEFHSMHHVLTEDLGAFLSSVRDDNHPPAGFLLERISVGLFGLSTIALRLPSLLIGFAYLFLIRRLCRRVPDPTARALAPWFVLASSYCLVLFTEARMYALLALATLGLLESVLDACSGAPDSTPRSERSGASRWWITLWIALGLHAHYYFLHQLALTGVLVAGTFAFSRSARSTCKSAARFVALPAIAGVLLWLPWAWFGLRTQLSADLPPGSASAGAATVAQSIGHLFHFHSSLGGAWLTKGVAWPGTALAAIALALGIARVIGWARADGKRLLFTVLLIGFGLGLPLWGYAASHVFERSTFGWRYIAGSAAPVFVLAAIGVARSTLGPRTIRILLFVTMSTVTIVGAFSGGQEDHRRMVRFILANAREHDAVLDKPPWDPDPIRAETSWQYYLPRTDRSSEPEAHRGVVPEHLLYDELTRAREFERVWVWFRDPYYQWVRRNLKDTFSIEETWAMGPQMKLHLFSRSADPR